jgi:hypothetical protein
MTAALAAPMLTLPVAHAQIGIGIGISVHVAPPALPVYVQPPLPAPGYLWTPGYWGPHVGFYGGVNYGFGFGGVGFAGGEWRGGAFAYNSAVANFGGVHVTNVYENRTIVEQNTIVNNNHVSFNGEGGISAHASATELQAEHEEHVQATAEQSQHEHFASQDRGQLASVNHGSPTTTASANVNSYHQVAQQHAQSQPISAADRTAGKSYNPNTREANQDQRIANGLRSGQMTSGEAARAERTQSKIDQQVHNDRAANGGKLTGQEKQQINGEQNAASRQIYNEKHNDNTVKPNAVDNREANQQQRTANGLRSGQMTSGEAAKTNANQAKTAQQVHNDRTANGGALNNQQKKQINKEQNKNSKQIYNEKHNDKTTKPAK